MALTLIHTSDWHLGHTLFERGRDEEHEAFLTWLFTQLGEQEADVLLVTGDVFDVTNPASAAMATLYRFLARASAAYPRLQTFVLAGNHDSPGRIDAPAPLLAELRVSVVGSFDPDAPEKLVFPLCDPEGRTEGWLVAMPFLRPADLVAVPEGEGDPMIEGVRRAYARALDVARARRAPGQALVATGHCYMVGGSLSELSERRVLGGNQHALPADIFPDDVTFVALGHLHRPQRVGGQERIQYAGSPIPLSMDERGYVHRILRVDLEAGGVSSLTSLPVPRTVELLRIPERSDTYLPLPELKARLVELPEWEKGRMDNWRRPFLEVGIELSGPKLGLHAELDRELQGKAARLCSIRRARSEAGEAPVLERQLADLRPEEVFRARWLQDAPGREPPPELMSLFLSMLDREQHTDVS